MVVGTTLNLNRCPLSFQLELMHLKIYSILIVQTVTLSATISAPYGIAGCANSYREEALFPRL